MANVNVQLSGATLQAITSSDNVQRLNSPIATIVSQATATFYDSNFQVTATTYGGAQTLSLPGATVFFVYIKNLSGANTVSVIVTVTGGAAWPSGSVPVLAPGGVFGYLLPYSAAPSSGITVISLFASVNPTSVEILLAS